MRVLWFYQIRFKSCIYQRKSYKRKTKPKISVNLYFLGRKDYVQTKRINTSMDSQHFAEKMQVAMACLPFCR